MPLQQQHSAHINFHITNFQSPQSGQCLCSLGLLAHLSLQKYLSVPSVGAMPLQPCFVDDDGMQHTTFSPLSRGNASAAVDAIFELQIAPRPFSPLSRGNASAAFCPC